MSIRYRKVQCKIDNSTAFNKWYPKVAILNTVTNEELCEEIAHSTTVTEADARAMLTELAVVMRKHLINGERVVVEKLGAFKVGIISKAADTEKEVDTSKIKGYRIVFQPEKLSVRTGTNAKGNPTFSRTNTLLQGISAKVLDTDSSSSGSSSSSSSSSSGTGTNQ